MVLKTPKEESYQPRECDVICGRGKTFVGHPGNKVFLRLVRSNLKDYVNATGRFDRTLIVSHIAANFREYGVRFARVGPAQPGMSADKKRTPPELLKSFRFYEINDERKIHEKIGHAFRDMIRAQSCRSTSPGESTTNEEEGESYSSLVDESDWDPSQTISVPTKVIRTRERRASGPRKTSEQAQPKPHQQEATADTCLASSKTTDKAETLVTVSCIKKTQEMALTKGHGHLDNLALAFFENESHLHKFRDEKSQQGDGAEDPFGPDVSLLFFDSDSLAGLSFNSHQEAKDSPSNLFCTSEDIPEKIVVHWSKERPCKIKRQRSDSSRDRSSLVKCLESNHDAEAVRWSASHDHGMSIDPRRLLQEPLINDWNHNAMEYCADFNPTNFDMNLSPHSYSHPWLSLESNPDDQPDLNE